MERPLPDNRIAFLGAGNMASALINGLIQQGHPTNKILASNRNFQKLSIFRQHGIKTTDDNISLLEAEIVVLCVKPQDMHALVQTISSHLKSKNILVSIAAGVTITQLRGWLNDRLTNLTNNPICRAMPNTPARYGVGITTLFSETLSTPQKQSIEQLFSSAGDTLWLDQEEDLHLATALSGSGPGYIFYVLEALVAGAVTLGLAEPIARKLALKTLYGSSLMAMATELEKTDETEDALATLRKQVTSKGGTTESGLAVLEQGHLKLLLQKTLQAAAERSKQLSKTYDSQAQGNEKK